MSEERNDNNTGGLRGGTDENSGPDRLVSAGGALGGDTRDDQQGSSGSAGDARPDEQRTDEKPHGSSNKATRESGDAEGGNEGEEEPERRSGGNATTLKSEQSEKVEEMLKQADKIVEEKGMTKEPEKEEGNQGGVPGDDSHKYDGLDSDEKKKGGLVNKLKSKFEKD